MTTLLGRLALTACAALVALTTSSAHAESEGAGSGNGNGDGAFALQESARRNPGLPPHQILLNAFRESQGRVPVLRYRTNRAPQDTESGYFFGRPALNHFHIRMSRPAAGSRRNTNFIGVRPLAGPLLPQSTAPALHESTFGGFNINGDEGYLVSSTTGLEMISRDGRKFGELRQYGANIVVYVIYATDENTYQSTTPEEPPTLSCEDGSVLGQVCALGYFWTDEVR